MNTNTLNAFLTTMDAHPLLERLFFASLELAVLALAVALAISLLRIRSPRACAMLWLIVLAKPVVTLAFGAVVPVLRLAPPEAPIVAASLPEAPPVRREAMPPMPAPEVVPATAPVMPIMQTEPTPSLRTPINWSARIPRILAFTWFVGVALLLLSTLLDRIRLCRFLARTTPPSAQSNTALADGAASLQLRTIPPLRVTTELESPAVVGWFRSSIVIPQWLNAPENETALAWALRHELTHLKHRDPIANALRRLAQILFFFHPVTWWASRRWEAAVELACDRAVVQTDDDVTAYAEQLYAILVQARQQRQRTMATGLFATRTQINTRIAALLGNSLNTPARLGVATALSLIVFGGTVFAVGGAIADREEAKEETIADEAEQSLPQPQDAALQATCESLLEGQAGAIVVLNADTGAVLAMASAPFGTMKEVIEGQKAPGNAPQIRPAYARAYQEQYPPGSTFKILLAAAALEEGVITPETTHFCGGSFRINGGGRTWGCWKRDGHGEVNVTDALAYSCDVFFYNVGLKLGVDKINDWSRKFGLGTSTGIDLPREIQGLIPSQEWKKQIYADKDVSEQKWYPGDTVNLSIGQGSAAITPLQNGVMMAIIANGGYRVRPRMNAELPPYRSERMLSDATLEVLHAALRKTVEKAPPDYPAGTGWRAGIDGIDVLGKTGSAQVMSAAKWSKYASDEEIPYEMRDHAWFIAGVMDREPKISVSVLLEHGMHGDTGAAEMARAVIAQAYQVADVPDDTEALRLAKEKVPLPPGTGEIRAFLRDRPRSIFISATSTVAVDEVRRFYEDYFKKSGWETFPPIEGWDGLAFHNDKKELSVTLRDLRGQTEFSAIYSEWEYTREEFKNAVRESASPEAVALIKRVSEAYATAESYADTGRHEVIVDAAMSDTGEFKTNYREPSDLQFEYTQSGKSSGHFAVLLNMQRGNIETRLDADQPPVSEPDISRAIEKIESPTGGIGGNIPRLLLELDSDLVFQLAELTVLVGEAAGEDGAVCVRLHGKNYNGVDVTIWVGKDDALLRKIETARDKRNRYTTIYNPQVNVGNAAEDRDLKEPVGVVVTHEVLDPQLDVSTTARPTDNSSDPDTVESGPTEFPARILHFPEDRSLGTLYLSDPIDFNTAPEQALLMYRFDAWIKLGEAQGRVEIPEGKIVRLSATVPWTDEAFATLPANGIQHLNLSSDTFSPAGMARHAVWSGLMALGFNGAAFPVSELPYLTALKNVHWLDLRGAKLDSQTLDSLTSLAQLRALNLEDVNLAAIEAAPLEGFATLSQLQLLDLSGTGVGGADLRELSSLTDLVSLSLERCPVKNDDLDALANFGSLENLSLERTNITNGYKARLNTLKNLTSVKVDYTDTAEAEHRAKTVGGRVLSEDGQPAPDVFVTLGTEGPDHFSHGRTNADGYWQVLVQSGWTRAAVQLSGGNQVNEVAPRIFSAPEIAQLREGTLAITARPGTTLSGLVLDSEGNPVAGARIRRDHREIPREQFHDGVRTDNQGRFTIDHLDETQELALAVLGDDHAPYPLHVPAGQEKTPVTVVLDRGLEFHGEVRNAKEDPVEGVVITASDWRPGTDYAPSQTEDRPRRAHMHRLFQETRSDAEGKFTISNLPDHGKVQFSLRRTGHFAARLSAEPPYDDDAIVYVVPEAPFRGRVVDADTGSPVTDFEVEFDVSAADEHFYWRKKGQPKMIRNAATGEFSAELNYTLEAATSPDFAARVTADGYARTESTIVTADRLGEVITIKLRRPALSQIDTLAPGTGE